MSQFAPLLAVDIEDIIGIVIVILFVIIPAALQLLGKGRQAQKPPAGKGQLPPLVRQAAGQPAGGKVEDEIGDFLRRAAQRRGGQQPPPPPPPIPAEKPAMAEIVGRRVVQAEVAGEAPLGEQVRQHVGDYLDAGEFARRASKLGDEVGHADEQLEQRLHQVFNHEVSHLARVPGESAAAPQSREPEEPEDRVAELPETAAAGLPALLSNAKSIRQAIMINEILTRPEQRWT